MTLYVDHLIDSLVQSSELITPYEPSQVRVGVSYGLSAVGYDARLGEDLKIMKLPKGAVLDPLEPPQPEDFVEAKDWIIPSKSIALGHTVETFTMPDNIMGISIGKSTYNRIGLYMTTAVLEPGWRGQLTVSLSNLTPFPIRVHPNMGICQVIFWQGAATPRVPYNKRAGKYQDSVGITLPRT